MKKYIILFLFIGVGSLFLTSCLEKYLDKAPASGLDVNGVFSKYANAYQYLDNVFSSYTSTSGTSYVSGIWATSEISITGQGSLDYDCVTDFCDAGRVMWWPYTKWGPLGDNNVHFGPILPSFFIKIRIANEFLQNVNKLTDGNEADINDLIGRAHFVRAFCTFEIFRFWGAMPYITKPIGPYDQWDIPRLSKIETMHQVALDMDTAYTYFEKAGKIRRDPIPPNVGNLAAVDQKYPTGCTAKAYKGRALLYAASPLNEGGIQEWKDAAQANWEAILLAEQNGYALLTPAKYTDNYWNTTYTNEMLWGHYYGNVAYGTGWTKQPYNAVFCNSPTNNSGLCPTQGAVDMWETKWGDALNTQAQRDAATALGHYYEQDPFVNRDPRFYIDIIYNGAPIKGYGTAKIYKEVIAGVLQGSELIPNTGFNGITKTGYYVRKIWGEQSIKNNVTVPITTPMIRLAELYLNFAEAANEAYGPNTVPPGTTMSAVQAINFVRNGGTSASGLASANVTRWTTAEMAPVQAQYTTSTDVFRPRIQNERNIELCFEGHYFFDERRWKTAPVAMAGPLMGNIPEKVPVDAVYTTGFKFVRYPLTDDRQSRWFDAKYYLPFTSTDYYKMKKFDPGQVW